MKLILPVILYKFIDTFYGIKVTVNFFKGDLAKVGRVVAVRTRFLACLPPLFRLILMVM